MKNKAIALIIGVSLFTAPIAFCADNPRVVIKTIFGDIGLELYEDEAPITVANFLQYVNDDFYDGLIFHRAMENFMIQGGSFEWPYSSYPFLAQRTDGLQEPIQNESDNGLLNLRGTISMALDPDDPNSGTSGFFINQIHSYWLDGLHTVFGKVLNGMGLVDATAYMEKMEIPYHGLTTVPVYYINETNFYFVLVYETTIAPQGYWLRADVNYDGIVDELDLTELCSNWLQPAQLGDLPIDGLVDFAEFALAAKSWRASSPWARFAYGDINNNGQVNFHDFALLAKDWGKNGIELHGDLNLDGSVDYLDLDQLGYDWLKTR
jgi:cyclophilin family peptidyl-prolyl cis-trans isomerase